MAMKIKGFGWKRDWNDPRDLTPDHQEIKRILTLKSTKKEDKLRSSKLSSQKDNRKYCSFIEDQGNIGSCTANAGVGLYEYMENKANKKHIDGSRLFLYKATRLLMGEEGRGDTGAYIRTTLGAIRLFGIPNEEFWPYSDDSTKFDIMPDPWIWSFAQNFQSIKYFRLDFSPNGMENIQRMKEYITKGFALAFGFTVFNSHTDARNNGGVIPYPSKGESVIGGHAVLIVGYDDNKTSINPRDRSTKKGCFLIRNSWGESWGEGGYGWLPYEYFKIGPNGDALAEDVWTITQLEWIETGEFFYQ